MFDSAEQLRILKEIIAEDFRAKEAGLRGGGYSTLFEVTFINEVHIPKGLTVIVNFDDGKKTGGGGDRTGRVDARFKGNLNVFVMKKKKVLKHVHITYTQETYENRWDTCSLHEVLESAAKSFI